MPDCLIETEGENPSLPIHTVSVADYATWLATQSDSARAWLESIGFEGKAGPIGDHA